MDVTSRRGSCFLWRTGWAALATLLLLGSAVRAADPWSALVDPENSLSFSFLRGDQPVFRLGLGGWGPQWAWVGLQAMEKADGDRLSARAPSP